VKIITHTAEAMNPVTKLLHAFLHQQVEMEMVQSSSSKKIALAAIATQHHVIDTFRHMKSGFSGHGMMMP